MHKARLILHICLALGVAGFLIACTTSNSSAPPSGSPPGGPGPSQTTEPYSIALGCDDQDAADYRPGGKLDRTFKYPHFDSITALAYDSSGDLFVGVNTITDSWVDEYPPGSTTVSRHISEGIHHPGAMATDPEGNLYVVNVNLLGKNVVMYKPESTKPDLMIEKDLLHPSDVLWAKEHLWIADSDGNDVRAYRIDSAKKKSELSWVVSKDLHGPSQLSETNGNLYVRNVPAAGDDYVREYAIASDRAPVFARTIGARFHYITAIATDPNENVYLAEWNFGSTRFQVTVYNKNGETRFFVEPYKPGLVVASPKSYYVTEVKADSTVGRYDGRYYIGAVFPPKQCHIPISLTIMKPPG